MKSRLILALVALGLGASLAFSAPEVNTWGQNAQQVWPTSGTADTLTRVLGTDSIATTSEVNVFGARAIYLVVRSDGSDSMAVPVMQVKLPNGQWTGTGGAAFLPPAGGVFATPLTATSLVNSTTRFAWAFYNEFSSGGTPVPLAVEAVRWRIKSTDARRYSGALSTSLVSTGNYTVTAIVWK